MTKKELVVFLQNNPGYLKKGKHYIASKFNISAELVKEARQELLTAKINYYYTDYKTFLTTDKAVEVEVSEPEYSKNNKINIPGTYWVTGCAHAPWQNKKMYDSTLTYLDKEVELQGLILAGDIIDVNSLSAHDRGKVAIPGVTLDWEYKQANKFLDDLGMYTKMKDNFQKFYIFGNHEDRYIRATKDIDVSKYGSALKSPVEGLKLAERGYNVLTDWKNDSVKFGDHLDICHGEFLNVHSAKKTIDTYRKSTMYFHTHRYQVYMEGLVAGWNMGAGADFNAPIFGYATRAMKNSWVNSSALVTLDKEGYYHVESLLFIKNRLIINGKEY